MAEQHEQAFTPERVDEHIEQLQAQSIQENSFQPNQVEIELVQQLQQLYQPEGEEDARSLAQVWERLVHSQERPQEIAPTIHEQNNSHEDHVGNISAESPKWETVQPIDLPKYQQKRQKRMQRQAVGTLRHRLDLIAAIIFLTLLIGSMIAVFSLWGHRGNAISSNISSGLYVADARTVYKFSPDTGKLLWSHKLNIKIQEILVADGVVYVGNSDGAVLYALDVADGSMHWHHSFPAGTMLWWTSDRLVYLWKRDSSVTALNAKDGTLRWNIQLRSFDFIGASHNLAYLKVGDNELRAYDVDKGVLRWHYQEKIPQISTPLPSSYLPAVLVNDTIYDVAYNTLYAVNALNGILRWKVHAIPKQVFDRPPVVTTDRVYIAASDPVPVGGSTHVYAFNAKDGTQLWISPEGYIFTGLATNELVFVEAHAGGSIVALNGQDGTLRWIYTPPRCLSDPCWTNVWAIVDQTLYLTDSHEGLIAVDSTGKERWSQTFASFDTLPVSNNRVLYFVTWVDTNVGKYTVQAINLNNGSKRWNHTIAGPQFSDFVRVILVL